MLRRLLPFCLLIIPFLEIAVFIMVGGAIGVLPTIAIVIITATIGMTLLRQQGLGLIERIRTQMDAGALPGRDLADGAMLLAAGLFLLTPGFVTDTIGFCLFVPAIRSWIYNFIKSRATFAAAGVKTHYSHYDARSQSGYDDGQGPVIDLDAEIIEPDDHKSDSDKAPKKPSSSNSPWKK